MRKLFRLTGLTLLISWIPYLYNMITGNELHTIVIIIAFIVWVICALSFRQILNDRHYWYSLGRMERKINVFSSKMKEYEDLKKATTETFIKQSKIRDEKLIEELRQKSKK